MTCTATAQRLFHLVGLRAHIDNDFAYRSPGFRSRHRVRRSHKGKDPVNHRPDHTVTDKLEDVGHLAPRVSRLSRSLRMVWSAPGTSAELDALPRNRSTRLGIDECPHKFAAGRAIDRFHRQRAEAGAAENVMPPETATVATLISHQSSLSPPAVWIFAE